MNATTGKIRFGVVGTNFISDWVIAGGKQDSRFELVAVCSVKRKPVLLLQRSMVFLIPLPPSKRWLPVR